MAVTPDKTPGSFGSAPPGAPHEVTTPGSERPTAEQVHQARQNERDLPAFAPTPLTVAQMASFLGKTEAEILVMQGKAPEPVSDPIPTPPPTIVLTDAPEVPRETVLAEPIPVPDPAPVTGLRAVAQQIHPRATIPQDAPYQPAASNTDSPARGIPHPSGDPGKQITGGFGDLGEAQYYPLDGIEVRKVSERLIDDLRRRIQDDLRFSIAATYPRVAIRVVLEVQCFAADHSFQIEKRMVPAHEKTPLDVAKQYGDEVVFCVVAQHLEMTDAGQSVTPPNAARAQLGLTIPRKQAVQVPGGRMIVDLDPTQRPT